MRKVLTIALLAGASAAVGACSKQEANEQNVAMDINQADPSDIETVPSDETSVTPDDQLANGADNADVADLNVGNAE
jgi:hypothetical protein